MICLSRGAHRRPPEIPGRAAFGAHAHALCFGAAVHFLPSSFSSRRTLWPERSLLHPAWVVAVAVLALNDHVFKGAGWLPGLVTGKLSDFAGLFAAPFLLAALLRVRSDRGLFAVHAAVGVGFSAIKVSVAASGAFTMALAMVGLTWRNWVDPTDLVALPALLASWHLLRRRAAAATPPRRQAWQAALVIAGVPVMLASGDPGGANMQERAAGSGNKGVNLALGEIAVDPHGRYFLSKAGDGRLTLADVSTRRTRSLSELPSALLVAFFPKSRGSGFYLVTGAGQGNEEVVAYDVSLARVTWRRPLLRTDGAILADASGQRVVLWDASSVVVLDATDGTPQGTFAVPEGIVDVDVRDRLIVTGWHAFDAAGAPSTSLYVRALVDAAPICTVSVPNCSSELVLSNDGKRGFLAPTTCKKDPVSVVNLADCAFETNLPGFGPVALSANGRTAVAFLDRDNADPQAPPVPAAVKESTTRFHLMFIDTQTLAFGTTPVGEELPRYAVTPDGQILLVDAWLSENNLQLVDVDERVLKPIKGPQVLLEAYAFLPDSSALFAIYSKALYRVDVDAATAAIVPLEFTPTALNMTPDGATLLVKQSSGVVHAYDTANRRDLGPFQQ